MGLKRRVTRPVKREEVANPKGCNKFSYRKV